MLKDRRKKKSVIRVQCLPMARLLSVQSREEFGISRLRRQLFKEYTISYVLESRLIFGRLPTGGAANIGKLREPRSMTFLLA